jgi:hypothetical protein
LVAALTIRNPYSLPEKRLLYLKVDMSYSLPKKPLERSYPLLNSFLERYFQRKGRL